MTEEAEQPAQPEDIELDPQSAEGVTGGGARPRIDPYSDQSGPPLTAAEKASMMDKRA